MVFGQPRQEDLLRYLLAEVPEERLEQAAAMLRIDLAPPLGIDADRVQAVLGTPLPLELQHTEEEGAQEVDEGYLPEDPLLAKPPGHELPRLRQDPEVAEAVITRCLPDEGRRQLALTTISECIAEAAAINPKSWALTLYGSGGWVLRLNVGMMEVFSIHADSGARVIVYGPRVSGEARALLQENGLRIQRYEYASQPMASRLEVAPILQATLIPAVRSAHLELVRRAAKQVTKMTPYARFHSPGVVEYLRTCGFKVPG
jgi:hypothetical protein